MSERITANNHKHLVFRPRLLPLFLWQDPGCWSTVALRGTRTVLCVMAVRSQSVQRPSSQTKTTTTVCPATRAGLLLSAATARRWTKPERQHDDQRWCWVDSSQKLQMFFFIKSSVQHPKYWIYNQILKSSKPSRFRIQNQRLCLSSVLLNECLHLCIHRQHEGCENNVKRHFHNGALWKCLSRGLYSKSANNGHKCVSSFTMFWLAVHVHVKGTLVIAFFDTETQTLSRETQKKKPPDQTLYQMLPGVTFYWQCLLVSCRLSLKEGWPIGTRCGTKSVFSAQAAKFPWLANPSPRRGRVRTVSSVSAACMPKSVPAATQPSQVSHGLSFCLLANMTVCGTSQVHFRFDAVCHLLFSPTDSCLSTISKMPRQLSSTNKCRQSGDSQPSTWFCMAAYFPSLYCAVSSCCPNKWLCTGTHLIQF